MTIEEILIDGYADARCTDLNGNHEAGCTAAIVAERLIQQIKAEAWADRYCTEFADLDHDDGCPARQKARDWLAEELRQTKEAAWDQGFDAGEQDVLEHITFDEPCIPNPYRSQP